jgi:hypothetical protein
LKETAISSSLPYNNYLVGLKAYLGLGHFELVLEDAFLSKLGDVGGVSQWG